MNAQDRRFVSPRVMEYFFKAMTAGRLAHAYLLSGPKGAGKQSAALEAAQMVNCLSPQGFVPGCPCPSCHKILSGNHPDVTLITRDEERSQILIEQIRALRDKFSLRVWEGRVRVGILVDADEMNTPAANALLKTLEEPCPGTLLILTSSAPDRIARTIRSRCHELLVPLRSKSELAQELVNEYHILSSRAQVAAGFFKGARAGANKAPEDFMTRRDLVLDRYILGRPEYDFIKTLTEDRELSRELLDIVLTFFRDVALVREGVGDEVLIHADRADAVRRVAAGLSGADVQRITAGVVSAIKGMQENMNIRLSLILLREMMQPSGC